MPYCSFASCRINFQWVFFNFQGCHSFGPFFSAGGLYTKPIVQEDRKTICNPSAQNYHSTENMTPSIIATCKQTRFHLLDDNASQEVSPINRLLPSFNCVLLTWFCSDRCGRIEYLGSFHTRSNGYLVKAEAKREIKSESWSKRVDCGHPFASQTRGPLRIYRTKWHRKVK